MILLLGQSGQLGRCFTEILDHGSFLSPVKSQFDLSNVSEISTFLSDFTLGRDVKAIINAAAYTQVDQAETNQELAMKINFHGVKEIAHWATLNDIPFVHFSTDYVYPGDGQSQWQEEAPTNPINIYGKSKLLGDQAIIASGCKYLIFRTSWVYSEFGHNFLKTMIQLGLDKNKLNIVFDQVGAPTYARDLARWAYKCLEVANNLDYFPSGIYHLCSKGESTWYNFALTIFNEINNNTKLTENLPSVTDGTKDASLIQGKNIFPIPSSAYPMPAQRPLNSRLDLSKIVNTFGLSLRMWQEGLQECLENYLSDRGDKI